MLKQTFDDQMLLISGAYPDVKFGEDTRLAWWRMLKNMGDKEFEMAAGAMIQNEPKPQPRHIFKYANNYQSDSYRLNQEKIKEMMRVCDNLQLPTGIAQLMINKTFGFTWQTIPEARVEDIKSFLIEKRDDWLEIVDPHLFSRCVESYSPKKQEFIVTSKSRYGR